ncbi:MAG TPA: hypothetical protein VNJ01_13555 [Bacteriovoracaceae bacterium]|nr:hypothetical protein [Bacteriovoracaceae bacterium]
MMKSLLGLMLVFSFACGHKAPPPRESQVTGFIEQWRADFENENKEFVRYYQEYLQEVERIYVTNQQESKFPEYLSSIRNIFELMAHAEHMLPVFYKKMKGRRASLLSKDFKSYSERSLSETHDRLYLERETKLLEVLGEEFFNKLKDNYKIFKANNPQRDDEFPI